LNFCKNRGSFFYLLLITYIFKKEKDIILTMLERLSVEGLEISKDYISVLDVYCSDVAKRILEGNLSGPGNLFDRTTQIAIASGEQTNPILLPNFSLVERNQFYGVNGQHLPLQVLVDTFYAVFMDTPIELPEPCKGEEQTPKHIFLKPAHSSGQVGKEFQLEFGPQIGLDLTSRLRDYLPEELLKEVISYIEIPA